jgi:hypothetical protein
VNFNMPTGAKLFISQCSTPLVNKRVPNSPRNNKMKSYNPYLLKKWSFWPPNRIVLFRYNENNNFFFNFEHNNYSNNKESL